MDAIPTPHLDCSRKNISACNTLKEQLINFQWQKSHSIVLHGEYHEHETAMD